MRTPRRGVHRAVHVIAERSGNGAERAENGVSGSRAVSGHSRKGLGGSGAWSGTPRSGELVSQRLERSALSGKSAAQRSAHMLWLKLARFFNYTGRAVTVHFIRLCKTDT